MLVEKPEDFRLSGAGITITGKADANLREILSDYPQLPVVDYTKSELQPELRNDIARQLKMQVAEMDEMTAVNTLLHFVQKAFNYQTDDKQFGFEKPLFPEESILYKRNDCEDRAIFFGMLIRNVLNLECLLVEYPGHIGTAVCLSDSSATGTYYMVDGKNTLWPTRHSKEPTRACACPILEISTRKCIDSINKRCRKHKNLRHLVFSQFADLFILRKEALLSNQQTFSATICIGFANIDLMIGFKSMEISTCAFVVSGSEPSANKMSIPNGRGDEIDAKCTRSFSTPRSMRKDISPTDFAFNVMVSPSTRISPA